MWSGLLFYCHASTPIITYCARLTSFVQLQFWSMSDLCSFTRQTPSECKKLSLLSAVSVLYGLNTQTALSSLTEICMWTMPPSSSNLRSPPHFTPYPPSHPTSQKGPVLQPPAWRKTLKSSTMLPHSPWQQQRRARAFQNSSQTSFRGRPWGNPMGCLVPLPEDLEGDQLA